MHAASLTVRQGSRAHVVLAGMSAEGYASGAGDLLHLTMMQKLQSEGVEALSLGGNPPSGDAGLRYYKASLGARPHTCTGGQVVSPAARLARLPGTLWRRIHGYGAGRS